MKRIALNLILSAVFISAATPAFADFDTYSWVGDISNEWTDMRNWFPGFSYPSTTDEALFNGGGGVNTTVNLGSSVSLRLLTINSSSAPIPNYVIGSASDGSQVLNMADTGSIIDRATVSGFVTINADITMVQNFAIYGGNNWGTRKMVINGDISGRTSNPAFLQIVAESKVELRGDIKNGASPALSLYVSGGLAGAVEMYSPNTYTGSTTINNYSTLSLRASDVISDESNMILKGAGKLLLNGVNEIMGTLQAEGGSFIDFGDGESHLSFANSRNLMWDGIEKITLLNFDIGVDTLRFGTDISGLTAAQLNMISLPGYKARLDNQGFVTFIIPEPPVTAFLGLGAIVAIFAVRRRMLHG